MGEGHGRPAGGRAWKLQLGFLRHCSDLAVITITAVRRTGLPVQRRLPKLLER